jgi:cytochrome c
MPFLAPQSLSNDDVYAVTAYLLAENGIIGQDATLDARSLARVSMPNRDGFIMAYPQRADR